MGGSPHRELTFRGQTKTLTEWAKQFKIKPRTLKNRLNMGWSVTKALTWPVTTRRRSRSRPG